MLDWITEPLSHEVMVRAFIVTMICGVVCGVVGTHVALRGMAFIGDAVSHAVFPGLAIAFVLQINFVIGGFVAGVLTTVLVAVFAQNERLHEDTVVGVFFAATFGIGIVILSTAPGYSGSIQSFLFGQIFGISSGDVTMVAVVGGLLLLTVLAIRRQLVAVGLDRETAGALGLPVFWIDLALYTMVTISIVISLQAVGNILVLALLITPAACARLLTDRLGPMMAVSALVGALSAAGGLYLSYYLNLAAGGSIVIVATAVFVLVWFFAPKHGLVAKLTGSKRADRPDPDVATDRGPAAASLHHH